MPVTLLMIITSPYQVKHSIIVSRSYYNLLLGATLYPRVISTDNGECKVLNTCTYEAFDCTSHLQGLINESVYVDPDACSI